MTQKPVLMVRLSGLLFWFDESLQASLQKAGFAPVSRTQSMFLLCLASGQNKPSRIAEQLGVSRQTISHVINDLTERGLITLTTDPADARARIVAYSDGAQDLRRAAYTVVTALEAQLKRRIGASAFSNLTDGLSKEWGETSIIYVPPAKSSGRRKTRA